MELTAVKNEQVSAQIGFGAKKDLSETSLKINDLVSSNSKIFSKENIQIRYVKYLEVQKFRSEYVWFPKMQDIIGEGISGTISPSVVGGSFIRIKFC